MVRSLNGCAVAHTVLTELDDQKLLSRGMASIKGPFIYKVTGGGRNFPYLRLFFLTPQRH